MLLSGVPYKNGERRERETSAECSALNSIVAENGIEFKKRGQEETRKRRTNRFSADQTFLFAVPETMVLSAVLTEGPR